MQEKNYVQMLIQSLKKKITVLDQIIQDNEKQTQILRMDEVDMDAWNLIVDQKASKIDEINFLDEGFEDVYERVKEDLLEHRSEYAQQVLILKELVGSITERSMKIQVEEQRNKELAQKQFAHLRKEVRALQQNNRAAEKYRKSMNNLNVVESQFLDEKN
ncbi:MAG: flagellar export chaperone FlgN [Lachnospiraceae bacterium]